ncbi:MAG: GNAT family N-acetyltransferase [Proteobacteria bacterium]|nr:GNAT family N-acetyltransferase [Pseudomonadota bacterium]
MNSDISIRFATEADAGLIMAFINDLAEYEKLTHEVTASADDIRASLFGEHAFAECLLAFGRSEAPGDGESLGFALFFHNYSTFLGKPGMYLEDLFVKPEARGRGIGKRLLERLAQIARERGLARLEWAVLDWNNPAIEFYESLDAEAMDDWTVFRLSGEALERLASK